MDTSFQEELTRLGALELNIREAYRDASAHAKAGDTKKAFESIRSALTAKKESAIHLKVAGERGCTMAQIPLEGLKAATDELYKLAEKLEAQAKDEDEPLTWGMSSLSLRIYQRCAITDTEKAFWLKMQGRAHGKRGRETEQMDGNARVLKKRGVVGETTRADFEAERGSTESKGGDLASLASPNNTLNDSESRSTKRLPKKKIPPVVSALPAITLDMAPPEVSRSPTLRIQNDGMLSFHSADLSSVRTRYWTTPAKRPSPESHISATHTPPPRRPRHHRRT